MYFDLKDMVRQLIRIIYKHNIQACKTEKQLITIDLFSQKNLISVETISLCFNVENNLRKMRRHDVVSRSKITRIQKKNCLLFSCSVNCLKSALLNLVLLDFHVFWISKSDPMRACPRELLEKIEKILYLLHELEYISPLEYYFT